MFRVELTHILLDGAMLKWLKGNADSEAKKMGLKRLPSRLDVAVGDLRSSKIDALKSSDTWPSIVVREYRKTGYYEVIDGRHRVVLAISRGDRDISCMTECEHLTSSIDRAKRQIEYSRQKIATNSELGFECDHDWAYSRSRSTEWRTCSKCCSFESQPT